MSLKIGIGSALALSLALSLSGCDASKTKAPEPPSGTSPTTPETVTKKPSDKGTLSSGAGVEKEKPAPGTGNVQGKVFYNQKPAENIEVKLCETFSQYMGGCGGEIYAVRTDASGEYLIKNVPPKVYEGLTATVFDTNFYVFITSGIVSAAKYKIEPDKTFFAPDTHLFKADLQITDPKAGSKIAPTNIEVKWNPYPDAAYYKLSIHPDLQSGATTEYDYIGKRVDGASFALNKPLAPGTYRLKVDALNANGIKLADAGNDIEFTVIGNAPGSP